MPAWLKDRMPEKARLSVADVRFEVTCVCGELNAGVRLERSQQVICMQCGEALFVLPRNCYPAPPPKKDKPKEAVALPVSDDSELADELAEEVGTQTDSGTEFDDAEDFDDNALDPDGRSSLKSRARQKKTGKSSGADNPQANTRKQKAQSKTPPVDQIELGRIRKPRERVLTPFRLMLLGIVGVLVGTGYLIIRSQMRDRAEVTLHEAGEAGHAAIVDNRIFDARNEFAKAADAATTLGLDAETRAFSQLSQQCFVAENLAEQSVFAALVQAEGARKDGGNSWQASLQKELQDQWFLFDSTIERESENWHITFPVVIESSVVQVHSKADIFEQLPTSEEGARTIFAARCKTVDWQPTPDRWIITLADDSVVLWTNQKLYESVVVELTDDPWDQQTADILATQKHLIHGVD